jgi:hypothetical protein
MASIEKRIDKLLSKDFTTVSSDEIINIITDGKVSNLPYDDLQSEE